MSTTYNSSKAGKEKIEKIRITQIAFVVFQYVIKQRDAVFNSALNGIS
jgi:hypothetical protein